MQAAADIAEMRRIQPIGPYHLLGWSYGGVVAYEMACQLEAAGEKVATLTLLDSELPPGDDPELTRQQVDDLLQRDGELPPGLSREQLVRLVDNHLHFGRLLHRYRPGCFGGAVLLFKATRDRSERMSVEWLRAASIETVAIDGNHLSMTRDPHAETIARRLATP